VKSPWKTLRPLDSGTDYLVLASSIPPRTFRSTWKLFRGAFAVRRQLRHTDGVMGFSLLAEPFRKRYATLSVWRDQAALDAFARAHPHDQQVTALRPEMGPTKFVHWTIAGGVGRPSWREALERLS
jgi:heme-degrading monooxygenase HmoA